MRFGLEEHTIDKINKVFETHSKIEKVLVFGSRAKGNYRKNSDMDLAVKGRGFTYKDLVAVNVDLDELNLPYKIDLLDYHTISEPALVEHIDRVGIELYSRWKEYKLGELCTDINYGYTASAKDDPPGPKFLRITDIVPQRVNWATVPFCKISKNELEKNKLEKGDIVIARTGATTGYNYMFKDNVEAVFASYLIRYRINKNLADPTFINYTLKTESWKGFVDGIAGGSAQPGANAKMFAAYDIKLPPLSEQTTIASVLFSLDDKIDLLHRQNKTLEELAETLFRQWFVAEAESWELKTLGCFIQSTLGGEWGKEKPEGDYIMEVQCIRGTDIADLETGIPERTPIRFIKEKKFENIEIKEGDLIMEISGGTDDQSTGRTAYINEQVKSLFKHPLIFSNFCRIIRPKKKEYSFFLYSFIHHLYKQGDLFNLENGSSGIKNLNYKALLFDLEFKLPNEPRVIKYNKEVEDYFFKINQNKKQVLILAQLRDTLLPKLMSGEVRVEI